MHVCCPLPAHPRISLADNDLHDRLLKEDTCDSINQSGQNGPGISSRSEFEELQTKVNSLLERRPSSSTSSRVEMDVVWNKKSVLIA